MKLFRNLLSTKKTTVEEKVVKTIHRELQEVQIGDKTYEAAPPTLSTIFKVSSIVSTFPQVGAKLSTKPAEVLKHVLLNAYQYEGAGAVVATLILGWGKSPSRAFLKKHEALANYIEDTLQPKEYEELLHRLLNVQQTADFFMLTATLSELNLIEGKRQEATGSRHTG